jgi:predicted metal-dependent hydrolase
VVLNPTHATAPAGGQLQTKAGAPVMWTTDGGWEPETMAPEEPFELHLALPLTAGATQIKDASQAWLMRFAKQVFLSRLDRYAPELGVQYQALRLSSANTRWGSADAKGHIRLNWRLIHGPLSSLDYVVVHELSHLREMNHSAKFWGTVASVLPDYAGERRRLNALQLPVW